MRDEWLHKVEPGSYHSTLGGVARDAARAPRSPPLLGSGADRAGDGVPRPPPRYRGGRRRAQRARTDVGAEAGTAAVADVAITPETTPGATGDADDREAPDTAVAAFVHVGVSVAVDGRVDPEDDRRA